MVGIRDVIRNYFHHDPERAVHDLRRSSLNRGNSIGRIGFKRGADKVKGSDVDLVIMDSQQFGRRGGDHYCIIVHGKKLQLCNDPLYVFKGDQHMPDKLRRAAIWLSEWHWFEACITTAIFANCIIMALPSSYDYDAATEEDRTAFAIVNAVCVALFCLECVLKVIARGLFIGDAPDACYLHSVTNWFDFVILGASVVELTVASRGKSSKLVLLRTFRILRPLRTIEQLPVLKMIVSTLTDSIPRLIHWFATVVFICCLYAILGMSLFGTVYWHRCRLTKAPIRWLDSGKVEWPVDPAQTRFCGGRYTCRPTASGAPTFCGSVVDSLEGTFPGIDPWPEVDDQAIADYGFSGFQTFLGAMATIFQVATMEGWSEVMYRFQDGRGDILALLYFISLLLFGGLLLFRLEVAILWQSFEAKMRLRLDLNDQDIPADIMSMKIDDLAARVTELEADQKARRIYAKMDESKGTFSTIRSICLSLVGTPTFDGIILTVIALNCLVLGLDAHPPPDYLIIKLTDQANLICTIVFLVEAILRITSFGFKYFEDYFNLFDLALVVVSIVEIVVGGSATVSSLRASRLLRLFKAFGHSVPMLVLYRVFRRAIILSCNFALIVILVLLAWTLVALHLFYEGSSEADTQIQFTNFLWAFIAMFQLLCGDRWHEMMVEHAHASSKDWQLKVAFFFSVFIVCHLVLMNLFLGMFVAAFAIAREEVIHDYRCRMFQFKKLLEVQASMPEKPALPRPSMVVQPASEPSWPNGALKIRKQAKTGTNNMNVVKMINIKLKAMKRANRKGNIALLREPTQGVRTLQDALASPTLASQTSRVSFSQLTIDIPADNEQANVSSATLMNAPLHQSMPPPLPDIIEPLPQSVPPALAAVGFTEVSAARDLLVVPGCAIEGQRPVLSIPNERAGPVAASPSSTCRRRLEQSLPRAPNHEGENGQELIALPRLPKLGQQGLTLINLPRLAVQGRSTDQRYTSILAGSRSGLNSRGLDEFGPASDSGLRRRHLPEVHQTSDAEVALHHALPFRKAYRSQRASVRGEHSPSISCSTKLRIQLRSELSSARSDVKCAPAARPQPQHRAAARLCQQMHASAENRRSAHESSNSASKICFPTSDDVLESLESEVCLPVRDNSRESCGSDEEVTPLGHLLVPVASHSAPPAFDQAQENQHMVDEIGPVAMLCKKLVHQTWFDPLILALIAISSILLAIETPYMKRDTNLASVLEVLDYVIAATFFCEMVAKLGAFGLWKPLPNTREPPYLRSGWNWLDGMVVLSSVVDFATRLFASSGTIFKILRAIRLLRAMRPLRLVQRNKGIKILVEALIMATPTLLRCLVVTGLFYIGFAILFMNLLKGKLWRCSLDPTGELRPDILTRDDCKNAGGSWINARSHFDQIGNSFAAVLHMGTGEGWVEVLQDMVNSVGVDRQPRKNASTELAFLLIAFLAMSNFFLVNLFIGVLIDQYCVVSDIMSGLELSDQAEKQFVSVQQQIFGMTDLLRPAFVIEGFMKERRQKISNIIQSRCFEAFIFLCILANSLMLCLVHPTMSKGLRQILDVSSTAFIIIFNVEACLKLFVYKADYFKDSWNAFDLTITLGADASLITSLSTEGDVVEVLHAFRVVRVLRLIRHFTCIRRQCTALLALVPATLNIGILMVLLLFMYACLGVGLFGTIAPGEALNDQANFKSFTMAFLTSVRIMTGEKWHDLMYDLVSDRPNCTNDFQTPEDLEAEGPRGCGTVLAYPFFVSFTSFVSIVMLNLIVAVVLQGYQQVELSLNFECYTNQVKQLAAKWREYDTESTGFLEMGLALNVLTSIPIPIGFKGWSTHRVRHMLRGLPLYEQQLHIRDVMTVCVKRIYCWLNHCREHDAFTVKLNPEVLDRWYSVFPGLPRPDTGMKSFFVAHNIIKERIEQYVRRARRLRAYKAQQDVLKEDENMQLQSRGKGAKAVAELLKQDAEILERGHRALNGRNSAGLPLQMPGGDVQGATAEEQRQPVSLEALTAGYGRSSGVGLRSSAAPLRWPPPMPTHFERQIGGDALPEFAPCNLVGSGFDTATSYASQGNSTVLS